ncbi:MAG TPA: ATP-binding protein [Steroidobacteraceae bacterium]
MPRTITLIYLAVGALWIFFTNRFLWQLNLTRLRQLDLQTYKGLIFVFGSGLMLYLLLRRYERKEHEATTKLIESQQQVQSMNTELERRVAERTLQLESANRELEAFAYAVSHDLRAPLRSMGGFSQILYDSASPELDEKSRHYLHRIHDSSVRMSMLIEDLLSLSRINRGELTRRPVDLSQIALESAATLRDRHPEREVELTVEPGMQVNGDMRLLRIAMENLLDNAWKYSAHATPAKIAVGSRRTREGRSYFVSDNGVGFDMQYAGKLFGPFQRLHSEAEFPGSGIGLVTVQRILARHGGRIWAQAETDRGATFHFTLGRTQDADGG